MRVHLWDLSGSAEYLDVRNELYTGTHAAFIVYDVGNQKSFDHLDSWLKEVTKYTTALPEIAVVANKVWIYYISICYSIRCEQPEIL